MVVDQNEIKKNDERALFDMVGSDKRVQEYGRSLENYYREVVKCNIQDNLWHQNLKREILYSVLNRCNDGYEVLPQTP